MTYSSEILARSPLLFHGYDDASGTTATDASGIAHDGTYRNGVLLAQGSLLADGSGDSAYFDGSNDDVLTGYGSWMNAAAVTVVARIKPAAGALDASDIATVFSRWPNTSSSRTFLFGISSTQKVRAGIHLTTGTESFVNGATSLTAGTEYTVAWRFDGSTVDVFLDGVLDGSLSLPGSISGASTAAAYTAIAEVVLGVADYYYQGQIQGLAWFGTALTDADLDAIHTAAVTNAAATESITLDRTLPAIQSSLTLASYTDTETANRVNGRLRSGGFVDESEEPVTPLPANLVRAVKVDKAFAYPTPTLIDGRPT